ncbi:sigma-70 family RNA polymerase sigma factor [Pseudonocardia acaciae]|uniref:sigma-70 family RNA polymerase sigma factor n=1 Tax=Pseudonocardia acaciae TaxID=551276 RepID=UPI000685E20B|nr:sigma-70 family RNA polymerase sigma factor [Pseudonocardia acaciae]
MDDHALTELALRAREGDRDAATRFVEHTQQQVWRMLVALSDRTVAEDLTQETYARAFRSLPGFRAESSVRAWLLAIARRVAADQLRAAKVRPQIDPDAAVEDAPGARDGADLGESVALHAMLDQLDPDRRLAFLLTQLLGLSYQEAAEVCGCPVGTIRSRVARARDELVAQMSDDLPGTRRAARPT